MKWIIGFKSGQEITIETECKVADLVSKASSKGTSRINLYDVDIDSIGLYLCVGDISYVQKVE